MLGFLKIPTSNVVAKGVLNYPTLKNYALKLEEVNKGFLNKSDLEKEKNEALLNIEKSIGLSLKDFSQKVLHKFPELENVILPNPQDYQNNQAS